MKKISYILLFSLFALNTNSQNLSNLKTKKPITNVFAEYSMLEVEFFKNGESGKFRSRNISSYVLGFNANIPLSNKLDAIGTIGMSDGFNYNFLTASLAYNLSSNFGLFYGIGTYFIDDHRWVPQGIDGNEPSNNDFGMNFGINLMLSNSVGLTMKYNIIEEKEEPEISSMSINGLSFGVILK